MIIGGLQSQIWSRNRFQSPMSPDLDLWAFDPKSIGHILDSWGTSVWSLMIISRLQGQLLSRNHFQSSMPHDLDLWPFYPKINRAHPWLMGSKCMKFHDHRLITELVMVRKPFTINHAPWPWPFDFKINRAHLWLMGVSVWSFIAISQKVSDIVPKPIVDAHPNTAHQIKSRVLQLG